MRKRRLFARALGRKLLESIPLEALNCTWTNLPEAFKDALVSRFKLKYADGRRTHQQLGIVKHVKDHRAREILASCHHSTRKTYLCQSNVFDDADARALAQALCEDEVFHFSFSADLFVERGQV
jgi:hypothetical protein